MHFINKTIAVRRWQMFVMLGASGFAVGNIIAKVANALGL